MRFEPVAALCGLYAGLFGGGPLPFDLAGLPVDLRLALGGGRLGLVPPLASSASWSSARDFETVTGMAPDAFIAELRRMPLVAVAAWFTQHPGLSEILDRQNEGPGPRILISEHEDALHSIERGYGEASQPQDYLKAFADFINSHSNTLPALLTVLTRLRNLTRKQLRELALELDRAGFSEAKLATAWREMTNQDIIPSIISVKMESPYFDISTLSAFSFIPPIVIREISVLSHLEILLYIFRQNS